jgi:hypothetical protein
MIAIAVVLFVLTAGIALASAWRLLAPLRAPSHDLPAARRQVRGPLPPTRHPRRVRIVEILN